MSAVSAKYAKKAGSGSAKKAVKKAKTAEVEEDVVHEVEEVVVAKKARAKSTMKASSLKNPKKRAREVDSGSEDDVEDALTPSSASLADYRTLSLPQLDALLIKQGVKEEKLSTLKRWQKVAMLREKDNQKDEARPVAASVPPAAVGSKKSAGKKVSSTKKAAASLPSDWEEEESSEEEFPAKRSVSKKSTAKKASATAKKVSIVVAKKEESDSSEEGDEEELGSKAVSTDFSVPKLSPGELKIVSWNVASYRAALKKGLLEYLKNEDADIVCLQETKVPTETDTHKFGYHAYFYGCKAKPGLHGTGLLTKIKPIKVDMVTILDDNEGRVMIAEYDTFYLINTYVPNSGMKLERLSWRIKWDQGLHDMILKLEKTKPIVWTGDLNVAKHPIDLANPAGNVRPFPSPIPPKRAKLTTLLHVCRNVPLDSPSRRETASLPSLRATTSSTRIV